MVFISRLILTGNAFCFSTVPSNCAAEWSQDDKRAANWSASESATVLSERPCQ